MDFVEQLKDSVDIVQTVQQYVRLKKVGTRYTGLCPFHSEKTPSFSVHPGHRFYKCFGCGEGGDVLNFIMKIEGLSFYEALKLLAERNGIPLPQRTGVADEDTKQRAAVYRMHEIAEKEFQRQLASPAGAEARAYLEKRGVREETIERFGLGFAPRTGALTRILQKDFSPAELEISGLVLKREDGSYYERFRNRLMFPIHSESGKPIAFGGRALAPEDQPKYLNSPETKIYRKSMVLYNLHRAKDEVRKLDRVILVEGYMDAIGVAQAGVSEVIASCGTALTAQQVQCVKRHSHNIVVNFDPDNAGTNAVEKSLQILLAESMRVRVLSLEGGLDPDEFCLEQGAEAYKDRLGRAAAYFHWMANRARGKFDMRSAEGRYDAFQFLLPSIQGLTDKLERLAVVEDVAAMLGVASGPVLENFRKQVSERSAERLKPAREPMRHADRILLRLIVSSAETRAHFLEYLRNLPSVKLGPAARIYEAAFALSDSGSAFTFSALHARLTEADQEMLASCLLSGDCVSGETEDASPSVEEGMACLAGMVEDERERERRELKSRVREAERAGNTAEALRLYQELSRLSSSPSRS